MSDQDTPRIRMVRRSGNEGRGDTAAMSPGERMSVMWQLAVDAWAFKKGDQPDESGLQRHTVRLRRKER